MNYTIYAARDSEMKEGWVWSSNSPSNVVKISHRGKSIYCECFKIDENFIKQYNGNTERVKILPEKDVLVISQWYRNRLGISKTQEEYDIEIECVCGIKREFLSGCDHPQAAMRLATKLAGISVILGILGLVLGIMG
ncbi:hypothetical protein [Desulfovibrio sp. UCD-KL4C]|uniref:hypothetical protein n=1 Tax=Desulfovibrio sp. UCD-KL4C TaxID=2578120 RepID=UPI0025BDD306|nr:hypothetical protein [Desulfovibrio sp. UCD-KL4C]